MFDAFLGKSVQVPNLNHPLIILPFPGVLPWSEEEEHDEVGKFHSEGIAIHFCTSLMHSQEKEGHVCLGLIPQGGFPSSSNQSTVVLFSRLYRGGRIEKSEREKKSLISYTRLILRDRPVVSQ